LSRRYRDDQTVTVILLSSPEQLDSIVAPAPGVTRIDLPRAKL